LPLSAQRTATWRPTCAEPVKLTARQPGVLEDPDQLPGAARHELRRLDHHRVAERQRRRHLPGRDGDREVPRGDQPDDSEWLAGDLDGHARAYGRHHVPGQPDRLAGEELEDLPGPTHLGGRLGERLALLPREEAGQLVAPAQDLGARRVQHVEALLGCRHRPALERLLCCRRGRGDVVGRALRVLPDDVVDVGRADVRPVVAADPLAADVVVVALHVTPPGPNRCAGVSAAPPAGVAR
jgi:hypothetical protein